ncbi:ATP-binding protein [Fibrobacterota bacterium]
MAKVLLREKVTKGRPNKVKIGKQLLDILTSGMYSDPLMVVREYVQNAADSIDEAVKRKILRKEDGKIEVEIDGATRRLSVLDNGTGITNSHVEGLLCNIGHSIKDQKQSRGFRGIGRLGGLGYCETLKFSTRSSAREDVAIVTWDGLLMKRLLSKIHSKRTILEVIAKCVTVEYCKVGRDVPPRFFRVDMNGLNHFYSDDLASPKTLSSYLSCVAPVPYNNITFPFTNKINEHLEGFDGFRSYFITLNNSPIYKPYNEAFHIRKGIQDTISDIELLEFFDTGENCIARGWYANSNFLAALPASEKMRGLTVHQGNIQIGNEIFLADMYSERRFATWHIGEIHVSYAMRPNARRDGFEQCTSYERFLENTSLLCRHLSKLCRTSSQERGSRVLNEGKLGKIEKMLKEPFFVTEDHFFYSIQSARKCLAQVEDATEGDGYPNSFYSRLKRAKSRLLKAECQPLYLVDKLDGHRFGRTDRKKLIESLSLAILREHDAACSAEDLLKKVLQPYLRKK